MVYQVILTLGLLWMTFGGELQQLIALVSFGLIETLLVKGYLAYRKRANKSWIFYSAVILAIAQLFIVKVWPVIDPAHP
ncbi:MAG: D-alanyl-lipoteichoic acid biosynthesis protein DltB, partial [Streptococcaceae bacterium]|nr:D-alanyl-lipoteichoic acid biosynthesis protein DltB [Streptococcaceae bacterium]